MANLITCIRIVLSAALLFCPPLSPAFYTLYISAGITDMIDGAVARKTGTVSAFGSKLDTIADIVFVAVSLIKLLPVLHIPLWLSVWIAVIACIKAANIAAGLIRQKTFVSVHSMVNKLTGGYRRFAVRFSADTGMYRFEVQRRSCLHGRNHSGCL